MPRHYLLLLPWLIISSLASVSQPLDDEELLFITAEYGRLNPRLLDLDSYPEAPDADVVILNDIGEASLTMMTTRTSIRYRYHRRLKFFSEAGRPYADIAIPFDQSVLTLTSVRGVTYSKDANGDPVGFEVDKRDISIVKLEGQMREVRFRLPLVKAGSVSEYLVEFTADDLSLLRPWNFQQEIPVALSEFHLLLPGNFQYQVVPQGDTRSMLQVEKPFNYNAPDRLQRSMFGAARPTDDQSNPWAKLGGSHYIFLMQHQPGIRRESFSSDQGLLPGLRFQLSSLPGNSTSEGVFDRWEQLQRYVLRRQKPRRIKADQTWIEKKTRQLVRGVDDRKEKTQRIFSWARRNLEWDGTYGVEPSRLDRLAAGQPGNAAAINLTLMLMLQEAGLDAHPVLVSTRDNGPIQVVAANLRQFNHLIVGLNLGSEEYLLDALSDLDDLGVLPKNDLNQMGYWIGEESSRWVRLTSRNQVVRFTYSRFTLSEDGWLTGEVDVQNRNLSAALERARLESLETQQEQDYLRNTVLTGMSDPRIMGYDFDPQAEEGKMVNVSIDLQTQDFVERVGDLLFIKPMMTKMVEENPFDEDQRTTPVDLNYPLRESHLLGLRIPPGYQIEQLPEPIKVMMPDNSGMFIFNVLELDNIVHVSSTIYVNQTVFLPSEYAAIQTFFDYIVLKHQEDIVLKRIEESVD